MNKKNRVLTAILAMAMSATVCAASAPIQRIDVSNLLSSGGSGSGDATLTAVEISFDNGGATPCYTTTLAFSGTVTVYAGADEACVAPIQWITVTPIAGPVGLVYEAPLYPTVIDKEFYLAQLVVTQDTPPTFDPFNGALVSPGTATVSSSSHVR